LCCGRFNALNTLLGTFNLTDKDNRMIDLRLGDCLEVMKTLEDNSIDAIICDLPYGTTQNKWDSVIPLDELWKQYKRIIKDNGAVVLTAQTPFDKTLGASNIRMLKYEWIWEKSQATGHLNAKKMPMKKHENILVFYKKLPTYNPQLIEKDPKNIRPLAKDRDFKKRGCYGNFKDGDFREIPKEMGYPQSIVKINSIKRGRNIEVLHPTQKPLELFEYLVKTYTNEGETVLDNAMGSGTTMVACKNTNRNGIGIEKEEKYFKIAQKRINSTLF